MEEETPAISQSSIEVYEKWKQDVEMTNSLLADNTTAAKIALWRYNNPTSDNKHLCAVETETDDATVGRTDAGSGQVHKVAADIALGAVLTGDAVPAIHQAGDSDNSAAVDGGQNLTVRGGGGANVHAVGVGAAIGLKNIILINLEKIRGDITGVAVKADLVPAVQRVIQNSDRHIFVQSGNNRGGSRGLRAHSQGRTGCSARTDSNIAFGGQCGNSQQQSGGCGENEDLCCLACKVCHRCCFLSSNLL